MIAAENIDTTLVESLQEADAALLRNDLETAAQALRNALELNPEHGQAWMNLGHVRFGQGQYQEALEHYQRVLDLDPAAFEAWASSALASALLGQRNQAAEQAAQALALDPVNVVALKVMARLEIDQARFEEGRAYCRRILALVGNDPEAIQLLSQCKFDLDEFASELPELPQIDHLILEGNDLDPRAEDSPSLSSALNPAPAPAGPVPTPAASASPLDGLLGDYPTRSNLWRQLGPEHLLQQMVCNQGDQPVVLKPKPAPENQGSDGFPVPPVSLTMGYGAGDLDHYLKCGVNSHAILTSFFQEQKLTLGAGDKLLDWGCAAGRVVRAFSAEAKQGCQVWGCDVDTPAISWAQDHLSPPFRFFNCTSLPHLPFSDRSFKAIYGLSVFTHLVVMRDMWLLELARILQPGGCAVLTIHDEHCWSQFSQKEPPAWFPASMRNEAELPAECVEIRGSRWDGCYTFFHSDYIRRVWGRFLDVVAIKPRADSHQAAVVLRKS